MSLFNLRHKVEGKLVSQIVSDGMMVTLAGTDNEGISFTEQELFEAGAKLHVTFDQYAVEAAKEGEKTFFILQHKEGFFYQGDNEDGTVKTTLNGSQAKLLTGEEVQAFLQQGGELAYQNWQPHEVSEEVKYEDLSPEQQAQVDTQIVGPGGNSNPPSSGLPNNA